MKALHLSYKKTFLMIFIVLLAMSCHKKESVLISDDFKTDANGWTIVGDAQEDSAQPVYKEKGGVQNGYIYARDDVAGGVWYFSAPESYLGDKSEFYGATLKFSLYQDAERKRQFNQEDVILRSGDKRIYHRIAPFPDTVWTHYQIPIAGNSGWRITNNREAGEQEVKEILKDLTAFWIRGEFETGPDAGGLDQVKILK